MPHKVLHTFREKEHDNHVYKKGQTYPAKGYKETKKRVEFLQKVHKEYGVAFLETTEQKKKSSDKT